MQNIKYRYIDGKHWRVFVTVGGRVGSSNNVESKSDQFLLLVVEHEYRAIHSAVGVLQILGSVPRVPAHAGEAMVLVPTVFKSLFPLHGCGVVNGTGLTILEVQLLSDS